MPTKRENNTVLTILDMDSLYRTHAQFGQNRDPEPLAQAATRFSRYLGWDSQVIALVARGDQAGLAACQRAGSEIIVINGDREIEIRKFIRRMDKQINARPPQHMLTVTNDPGFAILWDRVQQNDVATLAVWVSSTSTQSELLEYNCRLIEEMVPEYRENQLRAYLDYENIHIGMEQRGHKPNPEAIIEAIKAATTDLGKLIAIVAYADWSLLAKDVGLDIQRELTRLGVETRYQINMRGKNSADMKIADDLRTQIERNASVPGAIEKYALVSNDRDFRPIVDTIRARGKDVVIIGFSDGLSNDLRQAASTIRYLDQYLPNGRSAQRADPPTPQFTHEHADLAMQVEVWLNREGWKWAFADRMVAKFANDQRSAERLRRAVEEGVFIQSSRPVQYANGSQARATTYALNPAHPVVQAARYMSRWAPDRIAYCQQNRGMPYVDGNFLAKGMAMDPTCRRMGVGQDRANTEMWLNLLAANGLIVKQVQPNPKAPERTIATWWLPNDRTETTLVSVPTTPTSQVEAAAPDNVPEVTMPVPSESVDEARTENNPPAIVPELDSRTIRLLLTEAMDDEQLRVLAFDDFREVYERFGAGMPKSAVVQMLVENAIRQRRIPELVTTVYQRNPAGAARIVPQLAAA